MSLMMVTVNELFPPPPDFGQVETTMRCLDFAWVSTQAAHMSLCPAPLQLVTRVLIPKSEKREKKYLPRKVDNRLITIEYV